MGRDNDELRGRAALRVRGARVEVQGEKPSDIKVWGEAGRHIGFRVPDAGCRVQGAGCRVQGAGFRCSEGQGANPRAAPSAVEP